MMVVKNRSEQGQALVLIVLGIIGLLGFAALAIDGGRVYSDRRNMQNASDTASLSAAANYAVYFDANGILNSNWSCNGSWFNAATASAKTAAINRAQSNGYSIDSEAVSDNNGVEVTCYEVSYGGFSDKFIDIDTYITAQTPSSFAQFVFNGPLMQTVRSTARIRPQSSLAFGNAIVALNPAGCQGNQNGLQFDGTYDVYVNGGGAFSMGCLGTGGNGDILIDNGGISYTNGWVDVGPGTEDPTPVENSASLPEQMLELDPPDCTGLPNHGQATSGGTLDPGYYSRIRVNNGVSAHLNPGLYCLTGDFSVAGNATLTGAGVTIYMISGNYDSAGTSEVSLSAPLPTPDPDPALPLVLMYMDASNPGEIDMLGTETSSYVGTIYAPTGEIEIGGATSTLPTYGTQLIAWDVFVHGTATININYLDSAVAQVPPNLDLQR
jgi:hypothetical protein